MAYNKIGFEDLPSEDTPASAENLDHIETGIVNASPTGEIKIWATNSAPTGYLICDGSAISRTTYSALFDVLGTTYGVGDGSTTFNIPNLKGKTIVGIDLTQDEFNTIGETGGAKTHTLSESEIPSHSHGLRSVRDAINTDSSSMSGAPKASNGQGNNMGYTTYGVELINSTGGGLAHNNLPPYMALNYIIRY